jgi:glycosyltransferase involved in cell wall biosynthesis
MPNKEKVHILGIGSLVPVKRWDQVLRAAAILKARGLDCLVQIAGDGPLREDLTRLTHSLGLAAHVEFIGFNDNIPELIAGSSFLVHTSESEGCPNAIMEAMAAGRPVVVTNVGDVPYLVEDGRTGFIVEQGATAILADRMERLITDQDLCRRMGEASRAKAERDFKLERLISETLMAYRAAGWHG